jgi:hypothetical protein
VTADSKQSGRGDESALSRWSRRKLEARQQQAEPRRPSSAAMTEDRPAPAEQAVERAAEAEKPLLTDADMPAIDSLDENSDFSQFMSAGVSDELRNLALRKLFHAPAFNIRDGLDEYDDDFTSFEKLGDIVTSDMKHRIEMEQQKLRDQLAEEQAADDAVEDIDGAEDEARDDAEPDADQMARLETAGETGAGDAR